MESVKFEYDKSKFLKSQPVKSIPLKSIPGPTSSQITDSLSNSIKSIYVSEISAEYIVTEIIGLSIASVETSDNSVIASHPSITSPNTVCTPSRW